MLSFHSGRTKFEFLAQGFLSLFDYFQLPVLYWVLKFFFGGGCELFSVREIALIKNISCVAETHYL